MLFGDGAAPTPDRSAPVPVRVPGTNRSPSFCDAAETKEFAAQLKACKLDNGACLHIKVSFDSADSVPAITHAELLFGTSLKGAGEH